MMIFIYIFSGIIWFVLALGLIMVVGKIAFVILWPVVKLLFSILLPITLIFLKIIWYIFLFSLFITLLPIIIPVVLVYCIYTGSQCSDHNHSDDDLL